MHRPACKRHMLAMCAWGHGDDITARQQKVLTSEGSMSSSLSASSDTATSLGFSTGVGVRPVVKHAPLTCLTPLLPSSPSRSVGRDRKTKLSHFIDSMGTKQAQACARLLTRIVSLRATWWAECGGSGAGKLQKHYLRVTTLFKDANFVWNALAYRFRSRSLGAALPPGAPPTAASTPPGKTVPLLEVAGAIRL